MFNETAITPFDEPIVRHPKEQSPHADPLQRLKKDVATVLTISDEYNLRDADGQVPSWDRSLAFPINNQLVDPIYIFRGQLLDTPAIAYDKLDALLEPHQQMALFRSHAGIGSPHVIKIFNQRPQVQHAQRPPTLNLVLFLFTLLSVWYVGMTSYFSYALHQGLLTPDQILRDVTLWGTSISVFNWAYWWRGLPYALSILAILGGHELGHYFVARYHRVATSLPYFIPLPFGIIGTMGAVINLRAPIKNRRVLLDIAVAGPLVGVLIAVPILLYGLATSTVTYSTQGGLIEGNSILYALAKIAVLGEFYPNGEMDVFINQMAWAGWVGLLVTAFNLVPISQLDGGRILRAYIGEKAHTLHMPFLFILAVVVAISATLTTLWVVWILPMMMWAWFALQDRLADVGTLEDITPLDPLRVRFVVMMAIIFVLIFVPVPFTITTLTAEPAPNGQIQSFEADERLIQDNRFAVVYDAFKPSYSPEMSQQ
ncbi:MAG: site-2 protease family protein [Phototrophicaceae bacterium]